MCLSLSPKLTMGKHCDVLYVRNNVKMLGLPLSVESWNIKWDFYLFSAPFCLCFLDLNHSMVYENYLQQSISKFYVKEWVLFCVCWTLSLGWWLYMWCSCAWRSSLYCSTWFLQINSNGIISIYARLTLYQPVLATHWRCKITWYASIFAKLANTGSVANANVSEHSSTGWIICSIYKWKKKRISLKHLCSEFQYRWR